MDEQKADHIVEAFQPLSPPLTLPVASQSISHSTCRAVRPRPPSGQPAVGPGPRPDGLPTVGTGAKEQKRHGRRHDHVGPLQKPKQPDRVQLGRPSVAQAWAGGGSEQHARLDPPPNLPTAPVCRSVRPTSRRAGRQKEKEKERGRRADGADRGARGSAWVLLLRRFSPSSGSFYFILFRLATPLETTTVCVDLA
jgi:hypothetical protein